MPKTPCDNQLACKLFFEKTSKDRSDPDIWTVSGLQGGTRLSSNAYYFFIPPMYIGIAIHYVDPFMHCNIYSAALKEAPQYRQCIFLYLLWLTNHFSFHFLDVEVTG